jgi:hypothetical protein
MDVMRKTGSKNKSNVEKLKQFVKKYEGHFKSVDRQVANNSNKPRANK